MKHLLTQHLQIPAGTLPTGAAEGTIYPTAAPIDITGPLVGINSVGDLINKITGFLFPLAGVLLFLYLAWGGLDFLLSQGEKEKVTRGKGKITSAAIGFIILMLSYVLVKIISAVLGLDTQSVI